MIDMHDRGMINNDKYVLYICTVYIYIWIHVRISCIDMYVYIYICVCKCIYMYVTAYGSVNNASDKAARVSKCKMHQPASSTTFARVLALGLCQVCLSNVMDTTPFVDERH